MKLMTINLHSYIEEKSEKKLNIFVDALLRIKPDIIAMQEVNQSRIQKEAKESRVVFQWGIGMNEDNYGLRVFKKLLDRDCKYHLAWVGIKRGYKIYDEGLCILSKAPITASEAFLVSKTDDEDDWRKRMVLGVEVSDQWFYNVHMGRWDDEKDPFINQWNNLYKRIKDKDDVWIMGDFNTPADACGEGYDEILKSGFYDTYKEAKIRDSGYTVFEKIDGWQDIEGFSKKRIDYIFTNKKTHIQSSRTVFKGDDEPVISDHYGILVEV